MKLVKNRKRNKFRTYSILLVILGLLFFGMSYLATYVDRGTTDGLVKASEMFFNSDLLKEGSNSANGYDYTLTEWKDNDVIRFKLRNYPDSIRYTNRDITYTVEVNDQDAGFTENGQDITSLGGITNSLTLAADESAKQVETTIEIKLSADFFKDENDEKVSSKIATVKAKASAPYIHEITANFLVQKEMTGWKVSVVDAVDSPFANVTITAEEDQELQLVWDEAKVVPDQTNPLFYGENIQPYAADTSKKCIDLGTIKDTESFNFYMMKYDENANYSTNYVEAFQIIKKQGGG